MPFDFRPNVNIPAESMRPTQDPYNQILPMILEGQEHGRQLRSRQLIQGLMEDPALKADPSIAPFLPFIAAQPELLPQILPAMIRARGLAMKQKGGSQNMVQAITGPNGELRPDMPPQQQTPPPGLPAFPQGQPSMQDGGPMAPPQQMPQESPLAPGEVRGQMPFNQYTTRMQAQEGKKDASRKFQTLLTERSAKTVTPYDNALKTLTQWEDNYKKAIKAGEVGPAVARAGGFVGSLTGGKKFSRLFNYRRHKAQTLHTLSGSLGVGRFVYQAMLGISDALPNGTEDPARGLELFNQARANLEGRKSNAYQQLQNEMMLYRAVMMPGQQMQMPDETPPPQETPDPAEFEEP